MVLTLQLASESPVGLVAPPLIVSKPISWRNRCRHCRTTALTLDHRTKSGSGSSFLSFFPSPGKALLPRRQPNRRPGNALPNRATSHFSQTLPGPGAGLYPGKEPSPSLSHGRPRTLGGKARESPRCPETLSLALSPLPFRSLASHSHAVPFP